MEKTTRGIVKKVYLDFDCIPQSGFANPILLYLRNTKRWIPFDVVVFSRLDKSKKNLVLNWVNGRLNPCKLLFVGRKINTIKIPKDSIVITLTGLNLPCIIISNFDRHLESVDSYLVEDLIAKLKLVFLRCPSNLLKKAKRGDSKSIEWVLGVTNLYVRNYLALFFQKRYSDASSYSLGSVRVQKDKENINQIVSEIILLSISKWSPKIDNFLAYTFKIIKETLENGPHSQSEAVRTEVFKNPCLVRLDSNIENRIKKKESLSSPSSISNEESDRFSSEDFIPILKEVLSEKEFMVINYRFGLEGKKLTFDEIGKMIRTTRARQGYLKGRCMSRGEVLWVYNQAIKKLHSSPLLWSNE